MESAKRYIDQMNALLDELIKTATKLRDASLHVVSEEELVPLQKEQETILSKLEKVDQKLQKEYLSEVPASIHEQFRQKLHEFQELNREFISNIRSQTGLIQFNLHHLEGEEAEQ